MNLFKQIVFVLTFSVIGVACAETPAPAPPPPTNTPASSSAVYLPNLEHGQIAWNEAQCSACHGPQRLGGIGPQLASTKLAYDQFLHVVRTAIPPKPAYTPEQLPDPAVYDIYAWVRTQIPRPSWPGQRSAPLPANHPRWRTCAA